MSLMLTNRYCLFGVLNLMGLFIIARFCTDVCVIDSTFNGFDKLVHFVWQNVY